MCGLILIFLLLITGAVTVTAAQLSGRPKYTSRTDFWNYKSVNFDKLLTGTDKIFYVQPPSGKYWIIMQGSITIDEAMPDCTLVVWFETPPYMPYRNSKGEFQGCELCVTIMQKQAIDAFYPIQGQTMPLFLTYPNRLAIAVTPTHGGLPHSLMTWTRLIIVERPIPTLPD